MNGIVSSLLWTTWALMAAVLLMLMIDRGLVELHETNRLFLTLSGTAAEREQASVIHRAERLERKINELWFATSGLYLLLAAFSIYRQLYHPIAG
jgi:hypothetical protein